MAPEAHCNPHGLFRHRTRFLLLVLVTACLCINWANILTFNFTVICMKPAHGEANFTNAAANHSIYSGSVMNVEFTPNQKSLIMGVVAAGALIANLPIVTLINWYGPRYVFTVVGFLGAISTALIPMAMRQGFYYFLAARVMQGIAFAGDMATFGSFMNYWVYYKQSGLFTATLCTYVQLAPIFTNPISGMLCDSPFGWPGVYYFHAFVSILLFTTFFFFYRNDPNVHPFVGEVERGKISRGKNAASVEAQKDIPYKHILKSTAAWAVFIGGIGNFLAINLIYQFAPTYLNKVQGYEVVKTGFFAALPPLMQALMKETCGFVNDRIKFISETTKTRVFNSIAFCTFSLFIVILSFIPIGYGSLSLTLMSIATCFLGFNIGGFYKSGSLCSGPYAPFVLGQVSTAMTATMLIVPVIVNFITPHNTYEEWRLAFWIMPLLIVLCNIFYAFFGAGEPCYWAQEEFWRLRGEKRKARELSRASSTNTLHTVGRTSLGRLSQVFPHLHNIQSNNNTVNTIITSNHNSVGSPA